MFVDFRQVEDEARLEADLCIIGAGAAGITLARQFIGTSIKVILLESGASEYEPEVQSLYEGDSIGQPYDLEATRLRYFGGTTNHWEGVCGLLDDIDFEARPWVAESGWPISKSELVPFYEAAQSILQLAQFLDGERAWDRMEASPLPFDPTKFQYGFRQKRETPVRFGEEFESELRNAQNVRVFFHANATNIQLAADGARIQFVDLRTLQGKTGRVLTRYYVLACGAIENARLLLVSNSVERSGVGNRQNLVGRFFMEHPGFLAAEVVTDDYGPVTMPIKWHNGVKHMPFLKATPEALSRYGALNAMVEIEIVPDFDSGTEAARSIYRSLVKGQKIERLGEKVWQVLTDLDDVALNAYRHFVLGRSTRSSNIQKLQLRITTEQAPNPDSRITLASEKDALQLNKVRLDWRISEWEIYSVEVLAKAVGAELGRLGLARIKLDEAFVHEGTPPNFHISSHHLGTTRMADDPRDGVVDRNCRVHGIQNLHVMGSSVFPTGGYMNPTFTIVALAVRLARHLAEKLK